MAAWREWRLRLRDGSSADRGDRRQVDPREVRSARGVTEDGIQVTVTAVPEAGEGIRFFTRCGIGMRDGLTRKASMPVAEISLGDGRFVRLYIHPREGIVLSSGDLTF